MLYCQKVMWFMLKLTTFSLSQIFWQSLTFHVFIIKNNMLFFVLEENTFIFNVQYFVCRVISSKEVLVIYRLFLLLFFRKIGLNMNTFIYICRDFKNDWQTRGKNGATGRISLSVSALRHSEGFYERTVHHLERRWKVFE